MAPEMGSLLTFDGDSLDVFALGVVMFIMVTGNYPFQQATLNDKYFKLLTKSE